MGYSSRIISNENSDKKSLMFQSRHHGNSKRIHYDTIIKNLYNSLVLDVIDKQNGSYLICLGLEYEPDELDSNAFILSYVPNGSPELCFDTVSNFLNNNATSWGKQNWLIH